MLNVFRHIPLLLLLLILTSCASHIQIKSEPSGANVTINGRSFGRTPTRPIGIRKAYVITVEKYGYRKHKGTISRRDSSPYTVHLQRDPNYIDRSNLKSKSPVRVSRNSAQEEAQRKMVEKLSKKLEQAIEQERWEDAKNIQALIREMKPSEQIVVETNNSAYRSGRKECERAKQDYKQAEVTYNNLKKLRDNRRNDSAFAGLGSLGQGKGALLSGFIAHSSRNDAITAQNDMNHALSLMRDAKSRMSIHCRD